MNDSDYKSILKLGLDSNDRYSLEEKGLIKKLIDEAKDSKECFENIIMLLRLLSEKDKVNQ